MEITDQITWQDRIPKSIDQIAWHHQVPLPDGTITPGPWWQPHIERAYAGLDLRGKRCLDVGTLEGRWAYLAESMGAASVTAIVIVGGGATLVALNANPWKS
jgi:tRNA (mo5U34)-methyltransferase